MELSMPLYAATIFVSAFLLFLIQPLIAKQILPWFGGSAAVWITCVVFFQVALLAGYAYADVVVRKLAHRMQFRVHAALLLVSVVVLPAIPATHWKPIGSEEPSLRILAMLAATIGLPYFLLSTTSPLVQSWFARARPGASPYRLFALSNAASMLALIGYPLLLEPWAPTRALAIGWSIGYAFFVALCIAAGWSTLKAAPVTAMAEPIAEPLPTRAPVRKARQRKGSRVVVDAKPATARVDDAPSIATQAFWGLLAGTGALFLLAVTNHITQNIASAPLLWTIPLAIYLLTFILCFEGSGWYKRNVYLLLVALALGTMGWLLVSANLEYKLQPQIVVFCLGLFIICMFCHGELARLKPTPRYLTRFYLMLALGGAAGSTLVGIVAPLVLPAYFELAAGLVLVACLMMWQVRRDDISLRALGVASIMVSMGFAAWSIRDFYLDTLGANRNFYGVLRVRETGHGTDYRRGLIHGSIQHGIQYRDPKLSRYPTAYFGPTSGIGRLLSQRPGGTAPIRVGVVGLGIGTLAAWGISGDVFRFYEIDPEVIDDAQQEFTYLKDSQAKIEFVLGDGRLSLEREADQKFDLLILDAFFGDAIPVHLVTSEALTVYQRHVKPGGIIAFNVTNRFVDIAPVIARLAEVHKLHAIVVEDRNEKPPSYASDWVLLSDRPESLNRPRLNEAARRLEPGPDTKLWTDNFNSILQVIR